MYSPKGVPRPVPLLDSGASSLSVSDSYYDAAPSPGSTDRETEKNQHLWMQVILQALEDLTTPVRQTKGRNGNNAAAAYNQASARRWFSLDNEDFKIVSALAGVRPESVLAMVEKSQARGMRFKRA